MFIDFSLQPFNFWVVPAIFNDIFHCLRKTYQNSVCSSLLNVSSEMFLAVSHISKHFSGGGEKAAHRNEH